MKEAPFRIGDKVCYIGDLEINRESDQDSTMVLLIWHGMIAEITETYQPQEGLGSIFRSGDWIMDWDRDGCNLYKNEHGIGRLIYPNSKHNWLKIT